MELKDKIQTLRKARGLSQQELGDRLSESTYGVSRQAVSDWENGKSIPKLDNLRDVARTLNISFDVLLDDKCDLNDRKTLTDVISGNYKKEETANIPYISIDVYAHRRVGKISALVLILVCISLAFVIGVLIFKDVNLSVNGDATTIMGKLDAITASLATTNETLKKIYIYAIVVAGILPFVFLAGLLYTKIPSKKMVGHFDGHALTIYKGGMSYFPRKEITDMFLGNRKGFDRTLIILTSDGKQTSLDHLVDPASLVNSYQDMKTF